MKRVYVNEKWCLGCHLCEYYCTFASSDEKDMARALKDIKINPGIKIEEMNELSFAVSCRHCDVPLCVKGCITGALTKGLLDDNSEIPFDVLVLAVGVRPNISLIKDSP